MEERIFSKSTCNTSTDGEYIMNYYIMCNMCDGFHSYGIGIEKMNENGIVTQQNSVSEIFTTEKKAKYVLDILCRKNIMPENLESELEEMFKQDMNILHTRKSRV